MAPTPAFVGENVLSGNDIVSRAMVLAAIRRLIVWLELHGNQGYDPFDGLTANLRPLTLHNPLLMIALQQGVRRFPINLRPILGIPMSCSSKGMGFLARGFMRMRQATGDNSWNTRAQTALAWLVNHQSPGYSGACWGNHFDYISRTFYLPEGVPTIVWTALIGHAFLDAYKHFGEAKYLETAVGACEHITKDLATFPDGDSCCISYIPSGTAQVHNANALGASLLARTYAFTYDRRLLSLARSALKYTQKHQRDDGSWFYGEKSNLHWIDSFHTGYVLDSFKHYQDATGDDRFHSSMMRGYTYWKKTFFLTDGTPRYYAHKTLPLDIQCSSQAIDTLSLFHDTDPESLQLAISIARSTITQMQDRSGYFYYRRYSKWVVNKTPTLHWGQATMMCALARLYSLL